MSRVGVIDYGVGNLRSVANALRHVGAEPVVSDDAATLLACERIIFPGVGAFAYGKEALCAKGLDRTGARCGCFGKTRARHMRRHAT